MKFLPRVLVLGSGPIAEELAVAYRRLGCESVVGTNLDASGFDMVVVADDLVDAGELEGVAKQLPVVPTVSACALAFDRAALREKACEELGLPTLTYQPTRTPEELTAAAESIGYPLILKPRLGLGQHVATSPEELAHPFGDQDLMVERFIDFDYEVTILTVRSVDPETGELATWFCEPIGTRHDDGELVECWQPALLSEAAADNARSIAARITGALEGCGLFAIELFVDGEEVYFSQATPLPTLDGMLTRATQRVDQFELFARATLRLPIDVTLTTPGASLLAPRSVSAPETALARAMSVEETSGQMLESALLIQSTADTVDQARERAAEAARM